MSDVTTKVEQVNKALLDKEGKYLTFALGPEEYGLEASLPFSAVFRASPERVLAWLFLTSLMRWQIPRRHGYMIYCR